MVDTKMDEEIKQSQNIIEKKNNYKSLLLRITVEPLVLLFILPSTMNQIITQNLLFDKSCRVNLAYGESICDALEKRNGTGYTKYQEIQVHKLVTDMISIHTITHGVVPLILMFFIGSWSDKHSRRKPCILVPIIGELIAVLCLILNVIFLQKMPIILTSLLYSLPMALSGGRACHFLGVYSYITTTTSVQSITAKIGGVSIVKNIATVIGIGLSGIILNTFGFIGAYSTLFFMIISSLVYGYYIVEERKIIVEDVKEEILTIETKPKELVKDFFNYDHLLKTFKVCFIRGHHKRRMRIGASILLLMIVNGTLVGEQSILYLYTKLKFGWNHVGYTTFYSVQFIFQIIGALLALSFFVKCLKWEDETLGIISFLSSILAGVIFAFADSEMLFYVGALLDLFSGTSQIALRSLTSKAVSHHELGKANSIFGICEAGTHLIFGAIYTILYRNTLHFFPGVIFLLSSILKCMGIFLFIWLYRHTVERRKMKKHQEMIEINKTQHS